MNEPEIQLLLCCVRRTIDRPTADRIRAILEGAIDWTLLIKAALHHRVTGLLYRALQEICPDAVPGDLLDALRVHVEENAGRSQALADELLAIVADCERRSVTVIPFKGPTLATLAYGDVRMRTFGDLDLMVREEDLAVISDVLHTRGYDRVDGLTPPLPVHLEAAYRKYQRELIFARERDGAVVEPQWAITTRMLAFDVDYQGFWTRACPVEFEGRQVLSYSLEDMLLLLCIHGNKHYWSELRWVADIEALIDSQPQIDLEICLRRAGEQGCRRVVLIGLALAQTLLGAVLPASINRQIAADVVCQNLVAETVKSILQEDYKRPLSVKLTAYRMRARERARDRCLSVLRTIVTPIILHFGIVRLPPALFFLYYPMKVIVDYLLRPVRRTFISVRSQKVESQG